jgi:hypothetical protein
MPEQTGWPTVVMPERLDRRARLGPFPSARDAVKFIAYAAAGALLSPVTAPLLWLPVVFAGFLVSVWRPEAHALDERAAAALLWALRSRGGRRAMSSTPNELVPRHRLVRWNGRYVAVVRAGGTPLAYLPPAELARRFEAFRSLLRTIGDSWATIVFGVSIHIGSIRPGATSGHEPERAARDGYSELIGQIGARRQLRRVLLVLSDPDPGLEGIGRTEAAATRAAEQLAGLGIDSTRLTGRPLIEAVRRFDPWPAAGDAA